MKNIKVIALSLLSVMIGACNITNASNLQYNNNQFEQNISKNIIEDVMEVVVLYRSGKEPIDYIYRTIVEGIYKASNDKSLNTITHLVNKTIIFYNEKINFLNEESNKSYNKIKPLDKNKVYELLVLNRLENYENTTVRSVAKEFELSYERVQEIYFKYNKLAKCCGELMHFNYKDINDFLNQLKKEIENNNINIEDVRYIAYKIIRLSYFSELLSKSEKLTVEENAILNDIKNSPKSIPELAKELEKPVYKLMEIYLRNDIMARIAYDTITDFGNKKNETTTWENFLETFEKIAEKKYEKRWYTSASEKTDIIKNLFKLGESDNIKFGDDKFKDNK